MWLKLDLDGINFQMRIRGYEPYNKEKQDDPIIQDMLEKDVLY